MESRDGIVDCVLVPAGVAVMAAYHVWLLCRIIRRPAATIIGINAMNRRFWVAAMMQDAGRNGVLAVQTLRNNIMASTLLASTAIMLSSLIAVLMTGGGGGGSRTSPSAAEDLIFLGDRTRRVLTVKFFCILVCFLAGFLLNVQSIRYYSHASFLINVPFDDHRLLNRRRRPPPEIGGGDEDGGGGDGMSGSYGEYVAGIVNCGSYFWSLGLRAFYFSFPLFLWIFGPIPMFLCCMALVFMLYFLDVASPSSWVLGLSCEQEARTRPNKLDVEP